jgi:hypothetical protein
MSAQKLRKQRSRDQNKIALIKVPVVPTPVLTIHLRSRAGGFEPPAGGFQFGFFFLAREIETAGANEFDDVLQFVAIEPGAMTFANIDDNATAFGEIDAMHEFRANGTANVLDFHIDVALPGAEHGRSAAENHRLTFAIGADAVEDAGIDEEAMAPGALMDRSIAELDVAEIGLLALGAGEFRFSLLEAADLRAAGGAEFRSVKDHGEAGRTGDLGKAAAAVGAFGEIGRGGRAAIKSNLVEIAWRDKRSL